MTRRVRSLAVAVLTAALGCSYYNGMYNANHFAHEAEKAEREGRTFDAQNYWGQAAVRAESVIVRQPHSEWVDDALLVRGRALVALGQCPQAIKPLADARMRLAEPARVELATYLLAHCRTQTGDSLGAAPIYGELLDSPDPVHRSEARTAVARTRISQGDYAGALGLLDSTAAPHTQGLRMLALAGLGRMPEAVAAADSLIARGDSTAPWTTFLDEVGRRDPAAASVLVDHLRGMPKVSPTVAGQWLVEDALRLDTVAPARSVERLHEAAKIPGNEAALGAARLTLLRRQIARAEAPAALAPLVPVLDSLAEDENWPLEAAAPLTAAAREIVRVGDSVGPATAQGDLATFRAGELARDTLAAPKLALGLFRRVVDGWPTSPYAPKALLAGRILDSTFAAATQSLVDGRYEASPYLAAMRGEQLSAYQALEDSLRAYAEAHPVQLVRAPGPRGERGRVIEDSIPKAERARRDGRPVRRPGQRGVE